MKLENKISMPFCLLWAFLIFKELRFWGLDDYLEFLYFVFIYSFVIWLPTRVLCLPFLKDSYFLKHNGISRVLFLLYLISGCVVAAPYFDHLDHDDALLGVSVWSFGSVLLLGVAIWIYNGFKREISAPSSPRKSGKDSEV